MTTILYQSIHDLHISPNDVIWEIPLSQILLLLREKQFEEAEPSKKGIQLSTIELIDDRKI